MLGWTQTYRTGVMQKNTKIFITLSILLNSLFFSFIASADIEWSGLYRFEGTAIHNSELNDKGRDLGYGLHHLILRPKIIAGDGLTIYGQFNLLNSSAYPNSQMGQVWGHGVNTGDNNTAPGTTNADNTGPNSNVISNTQKAETIEVSQLYLTLNQEFGQFIVGRAPLQFGLGMTYSAGRGLFDHWYDTRDLVGYKIIVGNLYFLPMIGKVNEGGLQRTDDLNDYMIQAQYESPENDIEMGVFYRMRKGVAGSSDAPTPAAGSGGVLGGTNATNSSSVDIRMVNLYALRDSETLRLGFEASFLSGDTGVSTANGDKVSYDAFGIAAEVEYRPLGSAWKWGLKTGIASGDNPSTDSKFEGFIFNRNYDVAFLMFNHPLGQADLFRTELVTGKVRDTNSKAVNTSDTEAISNVLYIAPGVKYAFNDRWSLDNTIVTGFLNTNPIAGQSVSKDLGYEWDISLNFSPRKGVMWVNQAGLLFPGSAWKGGGLYDSSFSYGFTTKAAVSF